MLKTKYCNSFITLPQAFGWNNHPVEYVPHLMMMSFVGKPPVNVGIVSSSGAAFPWHIEEQVSKSYYKLI